MDYYHLAKSLHLIAIISWMAGMLYLPRLYVYHSEAKIGGEASEMLKKMEHRLLRYIINPAMIAAWVFGLWLAFQLNAFDVAANGTWLHWKLMLVIGLQVVHAMLARYRKAFARDERPKSARYFRVFNEVPTVLMIGIVFIVVFKF